MRITFNELLHGHLISEVPINHQQNLDVLLVAINKVRDAYGQPMVVTSGYRTIKDQMRINPKAPHSKHMSGHAVDILDKDGKLKAWVASEEGMKCIEDAGLYCEDFAHTPDWVHFQCLPPSSGKRFFIP